MLVVRARLNKTKRQYFTFIPEEGATYIIGYLFRFRKKFFFHRS